VITTERLNIFAPSLADLRTFRDGGRDSLGARLGVAVPADWPVFPETVGRGRDIDHGEHWHWRRSVG
jgi:hypothetical protein